MSRSARDIIDNDKWERYFIEQVRSDFGDNVSFFDKMKPLRKFGQTSNADADTRTTVAHFQGTVINETFATDNTITHVVSDSASDTGAILIEGHRLVGGSLDFVVQTPTLNGLTPVALDTPLCRATRGKDARTGSFASPVSGGFVGNIAVYDSAASGGVVSGVVQTAAATKMYIQAGVTQSEKCATAISNSDYWAIKAMYFGGGKGNASTVTANGYPEYRQDGGPWLPLEVEPVIRSGGDQDFFAVFEPFLIVPRNSDFRFAAISNTNDSELYANVLGMLAKITD